MKNLTVVFFSEDSSAAVELANSLRDGETNALAWDALSFDGRTEKCNRVIIMPDVPKWRRTAIELAYGLVADVVIMSEDDEPHHVQQFQASLNGMAEVINEPLKRKRGRPRKDAAA